MPTTAVARTEFAAAIAQICNDRKISTQAVLSAIQQALVSAYKKQLGQLDDQLYYYATVNEMTGESRIFSCPVLKVDEETGEILEWDETKSVDVTPAGFGRIAAQTAKQVILQKIRESEKEQIITDYSARMGEVISAQVLRMDGRTVVLDVGRGQAYMPPEEQMRGEFYRMNSRITVFLKEIRDTTRGQRIIVSRAAPELVKGLFEREVPEVSSGAVEIVSLARKAGVRTKLAVRSTQEGVDPVGSCVGQRGVRVQEVIKELNNEKIDIIPHADDLQTYVKGALAPAENLVVEVAEAKKLISVTVSDDQLSLAIGRGGQNVRLAAKLLGYKITIKSGGKVQTQATGLEQYEIDTFKGLSDEARQYLIQNKLTTTNDLMRFKLKWQESEDLSEDQKKLLSKKVTEAEAEEEARNQEYLARTAAKTAAETEAAIPAAQSEPQPETN